MTASESTRLTYDKMLALGVFNIRVAGHTCGPTGWPRVPGRHEIEGALKAEEWELDQLNEARVIQEDDFANEDEFNQDQRDIIAENIAQIKTFESETKGRIEALRWVIGLPVDGDPFKTSLPGWVGGDVAEL